MLLACKTRLAVMQRNVEGKGIGREIRNNER